MLINQFMSAIILVESKKTMEKKEEEINLEDIPNRRLTDVEKQTIALRIELSKLQREEAILILNKSIFLFFAFLAVGLVGYINGFLTDMMLNFFRRNFV